MPRLSLDDLIHREPQRAARWVRDHLPDVEHGGRDVVEWVQAHVPSRRDLRNDLRDLQRRAPAASAVLLPTLIAAAGAGAAFWWWTSWSRGRAEAERDARGGAEGAANPDEIMAHAPPPHAGQFPRDAHPGEDASAPDVMAHAPPPPGPKGKLKTVKPVVAPKAEAALRRNLAVQASEGGAKPNGAKPAKAAP